MEEDRYKPAGLWSGARSTAGYRFKRLIGRSLVGQLDR